MGGKGGELKKEEERMGGRRGGREGGGERLQETDRGRDTGRKAGREGKGVVYYDKETCQSWCVSNELSNMASLKVRYSLQDVHTISLQTGWHECLHYLSSTIPHLLISRPILNDFRHYCGKACGLVERVLPL